MAGERADIAAVDLPGEQSDLDVAETVQMVRSLGRRAVAVASDVRDAHALRAAVDDAMDLLSGHK